MLRGLYPRVCPSYFREFYACDDFTDESEVSKEGIGGSSSNVCVTVSFE
jgi:hypothetical protein